MKPRYIAFLAAAALNTLGFAPRAEARPAVATVSTGQFKCDDQPYAKGCGNSFLKDVCPERDKPGQCEREYWACGPDGVDGDTSPAPPRCNRPGWNPRTLEYEDAHSRWVDKVCGPSGANDDDGVNVSCDEIAWDWRHRRYVPMCGTRWDRHILADKRDHRTLRRDPWVRWYILQGVVPVDARIQRANEVVEECGR